MPWVKTDCVEHAPQYREHAFCSDYGWLLNQSLFQPRAEVFFPCVHQFSEYNRKETSASREKLNVFATLMIFFLI